MTDSPSPDWRQRLERLASGVFDEIERAGHAIGVGLLAPLRPDQPDVRSAGRVRVLGDTPALGVISDLDDTVIQSRMTSFFQAVRTVMLGNARTRLPFPGVAAFYRALEAGGDGRRMN